MNWHATAEVFEWTGPLDEKVCQATGSTLYHLSETVISGTGSLQDAIFSTGRLVRTAGGRYAALTPLSDATMFAASHRRGELGWVRNGRPIGEERAGFVFYNGGDDLSLLSGASWGPLPVAGVAAWSPRLIPSPDSSEAARSAWLGAGLVGLGLVGKSRRT